MSERTLKTHCYPLLLGAAAGLPRSEKQWNAFVFKKSRLILKTTWINTDRLILMIFVTGQKLSLLFSYRSSKEKQLANNVDRDQQTFLCQIINISGFVDHTFLSWPLTSQLCHYSANKTKQNCYRRYVNEWVCLCSHKTCIHLKKKNGHGLLVCQPIFRASPASSIFVKDIFFRFLFLLQQAQLQPYWYEPR